MSGEGVIIDPEGIVIDPVTIGGNDNENENENNIENNPGIENGPEIEIENKIENDVYKWLRKLNLKDLKNVQQSFDEYGVETWNDVENLDTSDVFDICKKIKKMPDRNVIKKECKKIKEIPNPGDSNKRIMVRDKEEQFLKKLSDYMEQLYNATNKIGDQASNIEDDAKEAKHMVNMKFDEISEILENRRKHVISEIDKIKANVLKDLENEEQRYAVKYRECGVTQEELRQKVYEVPISPDDLSSRADQVVDTIKDQIKIDIREIPRNETVCFTDYGGPKIMKLVNTFGDVGLRKCPVYFELICQSANMVNVKYEIKDDMKDEEKENELKVKNYSGCKINIGYQISYDNIASESFVTRSCNVTPTGEVKIKIPYQYNLWNFRIRYFDINTGTWSMYSDIKSIDMNNVTLWDKSKNYKSRNIIIHSDNSVTTTKATNLEYPSIFLTNIVRFGIHVYQFKIMNIPIKCPWGILFGLYKSGFKAPIPNVEHYFKGKQPKPNYVFGSNGYIRQRSRDKQYGIKLKINDEIKMVIDLDKNELSYIINEHRFGKAFDIMGNTSYKVGITLENHKCCVKFVSHTKL